MESKSSSSILTKNIPPHDLTHTSINTIDWSPFLVYTKRKREVKRIENILFYHQMKKNGYKHSWEEICSKINAQYNALSIPHKDRMELYQKEIEFLLILLLLLLLHDLPLDNYHNQGVHRNNSSVSYYHLFLSLNNSLKILQGRNGMTILKKIMHSFGMCIQIKCIYLIYLSTI